jgi:hypothetical protein
MNRQEKTVFKKRLKKQINNLINEFIDSADQTDIDLLFKQYAVLDEIRSVFVDSYVELSIVSQRGRK